MRFIPLLTLSAICALPLVGADNPAPAPAPASGEGWDIDLNDFIGGKRMNHDDWAPVEKQGAFGLEFSIQHASWPVALVANWIGSGAEHKDKNANITTKGSTSELQLGVAKTWGNPGCMHFTIAGGLDAVEAKETIDNSGTKTEDQHGNAGYWVSGTVSWTLWKHFNVGPQIAYSNAEVTLFNQTVRAGGLYIGLMTGYHF